MTTEREQLELAAKACGVVKPWLERLPSRLPLTQQACTLVQTSCMQAEIDELRAENTRLRDALYKIRQEPSNTMSDSKALKEIIRIARDALGNKS